MNVYDNEKVKYANIFNQRGLDYHKAMLMLPRSRDNEFLNISNQVEYLSEMTIIDMPSGGNYLKAFLPNFEHIETGKNLDQNKEELIKRLQNNSKEMKFEESDKAIL